MKKAYFQIKDQCRQGLLKYLEKAISFIAKNSDYRILDMGCGTSVPSLFIADYFNASITAIDTDKPALNFFQDKVNENKLQHKFSIHEVSFFDYKAKKNSFDIILAEGFLNVVGFKEGFTKAIEYLKPDGYFIIHDEFKNCEAKAEFIATQNCSLIESLYLDESVWWNNYYKCLNAKIEENINFELRAYFESDFFEIELYKKDATEFKSKYFIIRKNDDY